jgi:hypothetical protein
MLVKEVHNAYPNLPVVPFQRTTIDMPTVIAYIQSLNCPIVVKDSAEDVFRNEGGNGEHGICWNFIGEQADGNPIGAPFDSRVVATCLEPENGTNRTRRFCCFASYKDSVDILVAKLTARGLYIGGHTHDAYSNMAINTIDDFTLAYYQDWVTGNKNAKLIGPAGEAYLKLFRELNESAEKVIH